MADRPETTGLAPAEKWRDAVLDAMVCWEMWPQAGETPKQALNRLCAMEQQVALDPAVSQAAAKMRRAVLEAAAVMVREVHDERIRRRRGGFTSHAMMECQDAIRRLAYG